MPQPHEKTLQLITEDFGQMFDKTFQYCLGMRSEPLDPSSFLLNVTFFRLVHFECVIVSFMLVLSF